MYSLASFTPGKCQFCGAELADQQYNHAHGVDGTVFEESIDAEIAKTRALRADLALTMRNWFDAADTRGHPDARQLPKSKHWASDSGCSMMS